MNDFEEAYKLAKWGAIDPKLHIETMIELTVQNGSGKKYIPLVIASGTMQELITKVSQMFYDIGIQEGKE